MLVAMALRSLFPTRVYTARLGSQSSSSLNSRLLRECRQLAPGQVEVERGGEFAHVRIDAPFELRERR